MVPSGSALIFDDLMHGQRRTPTLCPEYKKHWRVWPESAHFSTMDFKSGFWQVHMAPESQQYTAFTVGNLGFYEFTRMPFGLCNAPATFQRLMQNMLGELNLTYCIIYLDDVIVYGRTEEEHLERLRIVLERFR